MENTNKHTKLEKLFLNKFFQALFLIFLFFLFADCYQILFSSIDSVLLILKQIPNNNLQALLLTYSTMLFIGQDADLNNMADAAGVAGAALLVNIFIVFLLICVSIRYVFRQTKRFALQKKNFDNLFYILFCLCVYSVCIVTIINTKFVFIHFFNLADFSISKMLISITIALIVTFIFNKFTKFTLKDKK
ncbi:hypothetical protein F1B92_08300 [Campylobacter sp. FMV-PI01]|uniref:Uncharacterized protein n=1 Tax=Campylobacter portucalensis TaxID=2608384 RepID=A0A6L5WIN4_9BACT|nr:hypothetical protein [Campylobacter portucalensis]